MTDFNNKTTQSLDSFVSISINSQQSYHDSGINSTQPASQFLSKANTRSRVNSARRNSVGKLELEPAILNSQVPLNFVETEEITVLGQRGIWLNKHEVERWRGQIPIDEYPINHDENPEVIEKVYTNEIEYVQEMAIRYLRPPTPPQPGPLIITEGPAVRTQPAPPLIIRQQPPRPMTPEPLVLREAPPSPPPLMPIKQITVSGRWFTLFNGVSQK